MPHVFVLKKNNNNTEIKSRRIKKNPEKYFFGYNNHVNIFHQIKPHFTWNLINNDILGKIKAPQLSETEMTVLLKQIKKYL